MFVSRQEISHLIINRLTERTDYYQQAWINSGKIRHLVIDDFLPEDLALEMYKCFPSHEDMILRQGPQEKKFISARFPETASLVEDCLYAFQDIAVIHAVTKIM